MLDATAIVVPASMAEKAERPSRDAKAQKVADIRSLKQEKSANTDREMTVLVAYYLQNEAPENERKDTMGSADVLKYFKQANHPIPSRPGMTLTNTKNAGYLEQVGQGKYRLNAVGYNLVAHNMPSGTGKAKRATRGRTKKTGAKKRPAKKTTAKKSPAKKSVAKRRSN